LRSNICPLFQGARPAAALWSFLALLILAAPFPASAQVEVDRTCATCSRKKNDSLNLQIRKIRLNQVGYRPQDPHKAAFVADPSTTTFAIQELSSGRVAHTGTLRGVGSHSGGAMSIRGAFNSTTDLYNLSRPARSEALHRADFGSLVEPGTYVLVCGKDTSASFQIDARVYNQVFETSLKFFGSNRCGKTDSWIHAACHLKDGDALGAGRAGSLTGGWHDCGDHGKFSPTVAYAAVTLAMTYAFWPQKGEDFYGKSYNDTLPFGTDGIPDVLHEAKIGADYILKLYQASKTDGLVEKGDMYHSVGMGPGMDHQYWDVPENQDAQSRNRGGPSRPVKAGIGANVAGSYAAALAFFAWGWEPYDPAYARECLAAATEIYDKIVMARRNTTTTMPCCYTGGGNGGNSSDDEGLAALALWYASKDPRFGKDLVSNPDLGSNPTAVFNDGEFPSGIMAKVPYHHGGWTTDYENAHAFVLYGLVKLIVGTPAQAAAHGLSAALADSLKEDAIVALRESIRIGSNGSAKIGSINADPPYNGVFTSVDWGYNRYNMGMVTELFMYWDLTGSEDHYKVGMDNLNYNLGMNSWDISFVMGTGDKNLQHP
ncbi:MAG TPA: glycoside hydrolase family 9 protein, partial [Fibrobacteria bacterium]|nr:glycoside hydrolase family 9 protein [Fibrobacteria bacterium]